VHLEGNRFKAKPRVDVPEAENLRPRKKGRSRRRSRRLKRRARDKTGTSYSMGGIVMESIARGERTSRTHHGGGAWTAESDALRALSHECAREVFITDTVSRICKD
jgi:hypothetical protein